MATPRRRPSSAERPSAGLSSGGALTPPLQQRQRPEDRPPFLSVAVRVKPLQNSDDTLAVWVKSSENGAARQTVCVHRGYMLEEHEFSRAFGPEDCNRRVFQDLHGPSIVASVFSGVNETLFAYGQTGSGKTHTIFGMGVEPGLLQFFVQAIFASAAGFPGSKLHVCCYEVFGDTLTDLVDASALLEAGSVQEEDIVCDELFLKTQKYRYQIVRVTSLATCIELLQGARMNRTEGLSSCNMSSSRSHAVVQLFVQNPRWSPSNSEDEASSNSIGALTLVDLAGAEKEHENPTERGRRSTRLLNTSLSSLNRLLRKLQTNTLDESERRQSVLNKCLWEYLRPGCGIALIFCVSPSLKHRETTLSTLAMATDSKSIHSRRKAQFLCVPPLPSCLSDPSNPTLETAGQDRHGLSSPHASLPTTPGLPLTSRSSLGSRSAASIPISPGARGQGRPATCGPDSFSIRLTQPESGPGTRSMEITAVTPRSQGTQLHEVPFRLRQSRSDLSSGGATPSSGATGPIPRETLDLSEKACEPGVVDEDDEDNLVSGASGSRSLAEQNEQLRRKLQKSRAKSHERLQKAERARQKLAEENAALRKECDSLRALFIRHQQQQIAFWTGPFMEMVAPSDTTLAPHFGSEAVRHDGSGRGQDIPVPDENTQVPSVNIMGNAAFLNKVSSTQKMESAMLCTLTKESVSFSQGEVEAQSSLGRAPPAEALPRIGPSKRRFVSITQQHDSEELSSSLSRTAEARAKAEGQWSDTSSEMV